MDADERRYVQLVSSPAHFSVECKIGKPRASSKSPVYDDVKLTGQSRQGVGKRGYILWQVDDMATVRVLSMR